MKREGEFWQSDDRSKGRRVPSYGGVRRKPSLSARVRAAAGTPEAVVKVAKFYRTISRVKQALAYQSRDSDLDVELRDGTVLSKDDGGAALDDLAEQWSANFSDRKDARNAGHLIISTPEGMNSEAVLKAARRWGQEVLAPHYDFAFTLHTDEPHPHVHFLIVREGLKGKRLGWSRAELDDFRTKFAKFAREEGLDLNATPRFSRGQTERSEKQSARRARGRLGSSVSDEGAAMEVLAGLRSGTDGKGHDWFAAMKSNAVSERVEYEALAKVFERISSRMDEDPDGVVEATATLLSKQSMALRTIITRRGQMEKIAKAAKLDQVEDREEAAVVLAKLYRAERSDRGQPKRVVVPVRQAAILKQLEAFEAGQGGNVDRLARDGDADAGALKDGLERMLQRQRDLER